ncbi:type I DNA topoisomerase [candidate division KSB1 bacterium]|nr:type I DNA topoisomerase [candidate division KSB1 bacterium]
MGKSLVIVESNAKTKTISKFLGKDFRVLSSVGHIKDLPKGKLGVDIEEGFQPHYITIRGKGPLLNQLRSAAQNSDKIYIATDPDREGEAIAWHIAEEIKPKNSKIQRVLFNEITKTGILKGMSNPGTIDLDKVEAQKARRVLDRLVGYQVSPILWKTIYRGLSAGRVQSVVLRLICEREVEIENFTPQEYWSITAELKGEKTNPFFSKLIKINDSEPDIKDQKTAEEIVGQLKTRQFVVQSIKKKKISRNPAPPFTTSTLQQEASKRLGFSGQKTMRVAQTLYEGLELGKGESVGLITYMRTDSTRIAEEALTEAREFIFSAYGKEYLPESPRIFKVKSTSQDAHEAIRPTSTKREPKAVKKHLTADQFKLYELIWNRFIASQMSAAIFEQTTVDILAEPSEMQQRAPVYLFRSTGSIVIFRGFLQIFEDFKDDNEAKKDDTDIIPENLKKNERLTLLNLLPKQHFTKPPARYTESSIIKELDALGIGRPSTYAITIMTIISRGYVERESKQLKPTELGRTVNQILVQHFPNIFNTEFTAKMETELDSIESKRKKFKQVVTDFYLPFNSALLSADAKMDEIRESLVQSTNEKCPTCGRDLVVRWGRNGQFMACSGYPDCHYTKVMNEDAAKTDERCEICGKPMVLKVGRFGRFLACSGYPDCKNTQPFKLGIRCPKDGCNGEIVERRSKSRRIFYGCNKYPECDFVSWYKPVNKKCPSCGYDYIEERYTQTKGQYLRCPKCKKEFALNFENL